MARKERYDPRQGLLPFNGKSIATVVEETTEGGHINRGKNYGFSWTWLYNHWTQEQAENVLYGFMNIFVPHEVLIQLSASYIASLYQGTTTLKRPTERPKSITYDSVEELVTKLIFIGRRGFLRADTKYETIEERVDKNLSSVSKEVRDKVVLSFQEPYLPSNREVRYGRNFYDSGIDTTTPEASRVSQLRQFWGIIKNIYRENTQQKA